MESRNNIKLNEESDLSQTIEGLLQLGNEVSILNDDVIKFSVIHTYLNTFFRFADKDYQKTGEKCAETYEFFLKVLIQSLFKHFKFISDYRIQRAVL